MKKQLLLKRLLLLWVLAFSATVWGQVTIFSENMGTAPGFTKQIKDNVFQNPALTFTGTADVGTSIASNGYGGASGSRNIFFSTTVGSSFQIAGVNTSAYTNMSLSFGFHKSLDSDNGLNLKVEVSTDGITFTPLSFAPLSTDPVPLRWYYVTATGTIPSTANLRIRFTQTGSATQYRIDDVKLTGPPVTPSISLTDNGTQIAAGKVVSETSNHILSTFKVAVTDANTTLKEARFSTAGTYLKADISYFKLWYNSTNSFAEATMLDYKSSNSTGGGDLLAFTGLTQEINNGSTGYFWVTGNIAYGATVGRTINLNAVPNENLVFVSGNKTGSVSVGGVQTFVSPPQIYVDIRTRGDFGNTCLTATSTTTGEFNFYGIDLTGNATVGPLAGYTFSKDNTTFTNELTLDPNGGGYVAQNVYIRFTPTIAQSYNGNVPVTTDNTWPREVAVTGAGIAERVAVTTSAATSITINSAKFGGTTLISTCGTISAKGVVWDTIANPTIALSTKTNEGAGTADFISTITGLISNTKYFYRAYATNNNGITSYGTESSFSTLCLPHSVPYTQDFESVTTPLIPNCSTVQNVGQGNNWVTASVIGNGFNSKVLSYSYHDNYAANAWFYTQGINLTEGVVYKITYKYGNSTNFGTTEKFKVAYGTSPINTAMTNPIAEYLDVATGLASTATVKFTAPSTGVFYFGFNVLSDADQHKLYIDDLFIDLAFTIWDGSAWSNGTPNDAADVIINGDYSGAAFAAKSITVNATKTLTVNSSVTTGDVTNNGFIIVNDGASLVQTTGGTYAGSGTFTVNKKSVSPATTYAFWSSPIVNQSMYGLFATAPSAVMTYNTATNLYDAVASPATAVAGVGYSINTPSASPMATFVGEPHNQDLVVSLSTAADKYNLVGNPYPSNLKLAEFYTANSTNIESTLWFWDNSSNSTTTQSGTTTNFGHAIYNLASKTWLKAPSTITTPVGDIAKLGQGFIVKALTTTLLFNNSLRSADTGVNFNRYSVGNEGKYWLTLSTPYDSNVTQAITYQEGAGNNYDAYDSKALGLGSDAFYSFTGSEKVVIQGKAPFSTADVVVLGNKHFEDGNFKIELTQKEGLFAEGQAIYLKDKLLGTEVNLQDGAYLFSSNAGEFTNRFEVVYSRTVLATNSAAKSTLTVYRSGDDFVIDSPTKIETVEVYDASGKLVKSLKSNAAKETVSNLSRGVFILKIKTASETVSKKVIK